MTKKKFFFYCVGILQELKKEIKNTIIVLGVAAVVVNENP